MRPPLHNGRMPWMMLGQIWASWSTLALKCWKPPKNSTSTSMTAKMSLDVSWRRRTQCRRNLDATLDLFRHFCENIKTSCKIFKVNGIFLKKSRQIAVGQISGNGILLPKLFWTTVRKNCSSDQEKLLKFEAESREFLEFLRSLEQFIQTVKGQNNFW